MRSASWRRVLEIKTLIVLVIVSAAFTDKTKVVIVNTPHNPSGKVFTREELTAIAEICTKHDVLVLADEVVSVHCEHTTSLEVLIFSSLRVSTIVSPLMALSTFELPLCQACGSEH